MFSPFRSVFYKSVFLLERGGGVCIIKHLICGFNLLIYRYIVVGYHLLGRPVAVLARHHLATMPRSIPIPDDFEQILIFSFMENRWFSLLQIDPDGFFRERCSFPLEYGANFLCVCDLRDRCYQLRWEDEYEFVRYRVIPSKYRNLYVLAPEGVPRRGEYFEKCRIVCEGRNGDIVPWPKVCYDPPSLLETCSTFLHVNGVGRREVAAVQPGLVWAMFEVVRCTAEMSEPERHEDVPMCPYSFHTWEHFLSDYERSEKST